MQALEESRRSRIRVFRIGPELDAQLEERAAADGITPSRVIRNALEMYLELVGFEHEVEEDMERESDGPV